MLKKANITWSAKQITKSIAKGTINFDNAVQRGFCWNNERKSLLIHSMIEGYPIPAFFAAKDENGYSMLDGKQRSSAIAEFLNNKYTLTDVPEILTEEGEQVNINGLTFEELSEEIQDTIKDYSLTIYYFDGITEEEINEMFFRLNNGKPLTAIELTRVKAKSFNKIKELGRHELFTSSLTEKALNKYQNEDIVIKSWILLNTDNPSFETKVIRPLIEEVEITDQQAEQLILIYNRILETYKEIKNINTKQTNKVARRIVTRTHLLSIVPIIKKSIDDNINIKQISDFLIHFYNGGRSASIDENYNSAARSHSASAENVNKRLTALTKVWNEFFDYDVAEQDIIEQTKQKTYKKLNNIEYNEFEDNAINYNSIANKELEEINFM